MRAVKVLSLQEKKRKKIEENLHLFQERFWEWVFSYRWNPCSDCTQVLLKMWGNQALWPRLCGVCSSYYYYYQVLYVRAIKTVCCRGEKLPSLVELKEWYHGHDDLKRDP